VCVCEALSRGGRGVVFLFGFGYLLEVEFVGFFLPFLVPALPSGFY